MHPERSDIRLVSLTNLLVQRELQRSTVEEDKSVAGKRSSFFRRPDGRDFVQENTGRRDYSHTWSSNNTASVVLLTRVAPMVIMFVGFVAL